MHVIFLRSVSSIAVKYMFRVSYNLHISHMYADYNVYGSISVEKFD